MHPVVLRGRTGIALGEQEFAARVVRVRAALRDRGVDALVAYGDARRYAPLAWLVGLVPMLRWAIATVPADPGPVSLHVAMPGARDLAAISRLAAVESVAPIAALPAALAGRRTIALAGLAAMRAGTEDAIRGAVAAVVDGDELLAELMATPSPGERELIAAAAALAAAASDTTARSYGRGRSGVDALLDGELAARRAGAHDVRVMHSADGGRTLRPLDRAAPARPDPFAFYLAVEIGGYWGDALRSTGPCAGLPAGLEPLARLGLEVQEGAAEPLAGGCYSVRERDREGMWSSRMITVA